MKFNKQLLYSALISLLLISCSDDPVAPPAKTAAQFTADGWKKFEAGEYQDAISDFNDAVNLDVNANEARSGQGWCYMMLDNFNTAIASLNLIPINAERTDSEAALAFMHNANADYQLSLDATDFILTEDPDWQFAHNNAIDIDDIYLLRAHNFISLGEFANALTAFENLDAEFSADVTTENGRNQLLAAIEALNPGISELQSKLKH
ncbi:MAG: hypothetical protein KDD94_05645 [Calditrichaeota bacterium]|nr:hypothetical protein [Calditrichota bacterium]